jgi:hypothetical protein
MHHLLGQLRSFAIFGKQRYLPPLLAAGLQDLDTAHPGPLLRIVDLAQVQNLALDSSPLSVATIFDDTPVAMQLAVFDPLRAAQKPAALLFPHGRARGYVFTTTTWTPGPVDNHTLTNALRLKIAKVQPQLSKSG